MSPQHLHGLSKVRTVTHAACIDCRWSRVGSDYARPTDVLLNAQKHARLCRHRIEYTVVWEYMPVEKP